MGHIYKRGSVYWIKYHKNGKPFYESSQSQKEADAKRMLKKREGDIANGRQPGVVFERVQFDSLVNLLIVDYKQNHRKSLARAEKSIEHLDQFFNGYKVPNITKERVSDYIETRISEGAANGTINRELAALKRILNLGAINGKVDRTTMPYIPMLKENNARKGFFEHGEFIALRDALPSFLKGFITFGYKTGWRINEIAGLTWAHVDRQQGTVHLEKDETKNGEGRTVYLDDELKDVFRKQWEQRNRSKKLTLWVFPNSTGNKATDLRRSWNAACRKAGIGYGYKASNAYVQKWQEKLPAGPIFHDFRRSAVRNMVRSGIPERVVMQISGHKTRSVFDRYNIVSDADLKLAAAKQQAYLESQVVTDLVTVKEFPKSKAM